MSRTALDVAALAAAVRAGSRTDLARAITLVESTRADHRLLAQELLLALTPDAGGATRVGVTGVPGAGKSTLLDELGTQLTSAGHRVAVLAVDPSSTRSRGSILGDKTRMERLSADQAAYIRPSPTAGTLGGVARATRESIVLVEAAGYDVVVVETVGVGQSEVSVAGMVDCFVLLTLARTGDSLQGIKKGVLELADVVAVNKADGEHRLEAQRAARELTGALRLIHPESAVWKPRVVTTSGRTGDGVDALWQTVLEHQLTLSTAGVLEARRRQQEVDWTWTLVREAVLDRLVRDRATAALRQELEQAVRDGMLTPAAAAQQLLETFDRAPAGGG